MQCKTYYILDKNNKPLFHNCWYKPAWPPSSPDIGSNPRSPPPRPRFEAEPVQIARGNLLLHLPPRLRPLLRQTQSLRPVTRSPQRRTPSPCRRSAACSGCAHNMPYLVQSSQSCKFLSSRPWKNPATPSEIFLNANEILYWAINVSKRPPGLTC